MMGSQPAVDQISISYPAPLDRNIQVIWACAHPAWNQPSLMDEKHFFVELLAPEEHQEV